MYSQKVPSTRWSSSAIPAGCWHLLFFFFISFSAFAGESITEIGQVIYSKSAYYFVFRKDDQSYAYQIPVRSADDREQLKSLLGKLIRVNGEVNFLRDHNDTFSGKEVVKLLKVNPFDVKMLGFDTKKFLAQEKYISHERKFTRPHYSLVFDVSDETANSLISASAVTLGILTGPISLIPLGVFGLTQF
jgi:hypothetical protein